MIVTVKSVDLQKQMQNKQTGVLYLGTEITYISNGKEFTKSIAAKFLDDPRQAEFKAKLTKLSQEVPKDVIFDEVVREVNGAKFYNLVDIREVGAGDAGTSVAVTKTYSSAKTTLGKTFEARDPNAVTKKDLTIARAVGLKAAVELSKDGDIEKIKALASELANYTLEPYGIDVNGNKV